MRLAEIYSVGGGAGTSGRGVMWEDSGMGAVEVSVSDASQIRPLREWLERIPGLQVRQVAGRPAAHEQGVADALTILASGGGVLAVAIRSIPEFLRSRRTDVTVAVKAGGAEFTLTAATADDAIRVLVKVLDGDDRG
jgi:hypothetical protein